ncbi:uncharacterized protein LOC144296536 [Canis aureus]
MEKFDCFCLEVHGLGRLQTMCRCLNCSQMDTHSNNAKMSILVHVSLVICTVDNVGEDVEKGEPSCTVGGNVNWCSHSGKLWRFLKDLKIDLPYDPAIALLGIYPKDADAVKLWNTCTPMFIAAMSTIAKLWKEPPCPSKD